MHYVFTLPFAGNCPVSYANGEMVNVCWKNHFQERFRDTKAALCLTVIGNSVCAGLSPRQIA